MNSSSIQDSFKLFVEPGSLTEVRVLLRSPDNDEERICRNQFYFGREADKVARDLEQFEKNPDCIGCYFVINPIKPDLYAHNKIKWRPPFQTKVDSSKSNDIIRRKWLFIDCDSNRGADLSATDNERSFAVSLSRDIVQSLSLLGFASPVLGDSGNGVHIYYPVDLPNDKIIQSQIKEFLHELSLRFYNQGAKVDPVTFDCQRMGRVYGTIARKGSSTPERPWRKTGILSSGELTEGVRDRNNKAIQTALELWRTQYYDGGDAKSNLDLARLYLEKADGAVSGSNGSGTTFRIACTLLEGFALSEDEAFQAISEWNSKCVPPWEERDLRKKLRDAGERIDRSKIGCLVRKKDKVSLQNDELPKEGSPGKSDATVADLIRMGQSMQWIWPGWIQRGAIVGIAAQPGAGKTRTCADIAKRIYHGMPWPDGTARTLDPQSKVLWLACDNQWGEIATFPEQFGIPPEAIYLNSWGDDPTNGTVLDSIKDFKGLEDRIIRTGVSITFIDTVMNSTTHNTMRPEDGIKFFKPLAEVAMRTNTAIVMVTHLSANNEALGRRIVGQCRQMINLEKIEGEPNNSTKRRMFVSKSNSMIPPELTVTLKSDGADYAYTSGQTPQTSNAAQSKTDTRGLPPIKTWATDLCRSGKISRNLAIYYAKLVGYTDADIEGASKNGSR